MAVIVGPDNVNWVEVEAIERPINTWDICYAQPLNKYIAVSYNGYDQILISEDGYSWATCLRGDAPGQPQRGWKGVAYGNIGAAVGNDGILVSLNGLVWTRPDIPHLQYTSITYASNINKFVAMTATGTAVLFEYDGSTISYVTTTIPSANWTSVTYSNSLNKFVAVSYADEISSISSTDGIIWTDTSDLPKNSWAKIIWIDSLNKFIAVSNSGSDHVYESVDGESWSEVVVNGGYWRDITWSPIMNMFTLVSSSTEINNASSNDGGSSFVEYQSRRIASIEWNEIAQLFVANVILIDGDTPYNTLVGIPTPTPSVTATVTPSVTATVTATVTPTTTVTPTVTPSSTVTPTPGVSNTPTPAPSNTPAISSTPTPAPSSTPAPSNTPAPANTPAISSTPTPAPSNTPGPSNTPAPSSTPTPAAVTPPVSPTPSPFAPMSAGAGTNLDAFDIIMWDMPCRTPTQAGLAQDSVIINVAGGSGSFTYSWSIVTDPASNFPVQIAPSGNSATVRDILIRNCPYQGGSFGTVSVLVTDTVTGATATFNGSFTLEYTG